MSIADMMSKMGGEEKKSPSARNKVRDGGHEPGSIAEHLKQMHPEWDKLWDKRKRIWEGAAELFEQEQALREKA